MNYVGQVSFFPIDDRAQSVLGIPERDVWIARNQVTEREELLYRPSQPGDEFLKVYNGLVEYVRYSSASDQSHRLGWQVEVEETFALWDDERKFTLVDYQELLRTECANRNTLPAGLKHFRDGRWRHGPSAHIAESEVSPVSTPLPSLKELLRCPS